MKVGPEEGACMRGVGCGVVGCDMGCGGGVGHDVWRRWRMHDIWTA